MSFDIRKVKNMKSSVYQIMLFGLLVFNSTVYPNEPNILWNDECPAVVLGTEQERQALKKEFPEHDDWFGTLLNCKYLGQISGYTRISGDTLLREYLGTPYNGTKLREFGLKSKLA